MALGCEFTGELAIGAIPQRESIRARRAIGNKRSDCRSLSPRVIDVGRRESISSTVKYEWGIRIKLANRVVIPQHVHPNPSVRLTDHDVGLRIDGRAVWILDVVNRASFDPPGSTYVWAICEF